MYIPTYMIVLWFCSVQAPNCAVYNGAYNTMKVFPAESRSRCEEMWAEYMSVPDPPGFISRHECQPTKEPL